MPPSSYNESKPLAATYGNLSRSLLSNPLCHANFAPDDGGKGGDGSGEGSGGDGNGSDGGAPAQTTPASPSEGGAGRTFTQDELNEIVGRARQEERRKAERRTADSKKPPGGEDDPGPAGGSGALTAEQIESLLEKKLGEALGGFSKNQTFESLAADSGLGPEQKELLKLKFKTDSPQDVKEWFAKHQQLFGGAKSPIGENEVGVATSNGGTPREVEELEKDGYVDVFQLTEEQIERMGMDELVKQYERTRDAAKRQSGAPRLPKFLRQSGE